MILIYFKMDFMVQKIDFNKKSDLNDPISVTYNSNIQEPQKNSSVLVNHVPFHKCSHCDARFTVKHRLRTHERTVHKLSQFLCYICKKGYIEKKNLINHILSHRGPEGFKCNVCNKIRLNYAAMKRHWKTHAQKSILCSSCGALFRTKWELKSHAIQHKKTQNCEKPCKMLGEEMKEWKCKICNKFYKSQQSLKNHIKMHNVDKPYKCQYCSMSFLTSSARKSHSEEHKQNRHAHECCDCGKKYVSSTSLAVHKLRFHSCITYNCKYCREKFPSEDDLSKHLIIHVMEKPHCCQLCFRRYKHRRELRRHQRDKKHGN